MKSSGNKPTKIIHCAANVDFVNDEFAESSNLGLTWDLLSYASTIHDFKCFIHVSTLSIRGDGNRTFSEDSLDIEQHFMTPYALTKFLGEIMIKRFHRNIPFCIVRLGTVLGWGSNEIFGINNDWLFQSVRLWIAGYLTALPLSPKQSFHLITPDAVARGLLCLLSKENLPSVLHMPTKPGPCVEEIFDLLSQKAKTKQPMLLAQDSVEWNAYRSSAKKRLRMVVDKIYPPPPPGLHVVDVDSSFSHAWFKNNGISVNDIPLSCLELIIPEVLKIIK